MIELKEKVRAAVSCLTTRNVVIVDDDEPYIDLPPQEAWVELKEILQQAPSVYKAFLQLADEQGCNLADPPTVDLIRLAIRNANHNDAGLNDAVIRYAQTKHFLAHLRDLLVELGFSVSIYEYTPTLDRTFPPFLVLVDFHFEGEAHEGQNAERTISDLMRPDLSVPPFVLLMSKRLERSQCERWTKVVERTGFFRFNYDFLPKKRIEESAAHLYFAILNFIQHASVAQGYLIQMKTLQDETKSLVESVAKELFQVSPAEAQMFRQRMQVEGVPLARVFMRLFVDRLELSLSNSGNVISAMEKFEMAVDKEGIPSVSIRECGNLHRLYGELLHRSPITDEFPRFGDIYKREDGSLILLLSQECDIASGKDRRPKSDRVLALEGTIEVREAGENDGPVISKPYFDENQSLCWLWWHLQRPVILSFESFSVESIIYNRPRLRKFLSLRFSDADEIQNAFAFHLARVGTDVMPSPVIRFTVEVGSCQGDGAIQRGKELWFYSLTMKGERFLSLCPDSKVAALGSEASPFLSFETVLKLVRFISTKEFCAMLRPEKIIAEAQQGQLARLVKYAARKPRGVSEWNG